MNLIKVIVTPPWRRAVLWVLLTLAMAFLMTKRPQGQTASPELWVPVNVPTWRVG